MPAGRILLLPATVALAYYCDEENIGLLNTVQMPAWLQWGLGLLVLDYAIYLWHRANHIFPFLWRFHNVHHIDPEMDVSTGIRFHIGEMLLSIPFRCLIILVSGVSPMMLLVYELIFEAATLFHHSNIRLPLLLERVVVEFIVTPRMHGIHHSMVERETNSNYSTVLNIWDRIH
ncbi:MAG TPA: sterol desaturase family protein, partial [Cryomorphaceae bacterium]|nr:sterol desaturase family protein [Cryomorphaceae bacterium]